MPSLVLDASVTLSSVFPDERETGPTVDSLLQNARVLVPPIWPAEVVNGLLVGLRRGRIDRISVEAAVGFLSRLPISVTELGIIEYGEQVLPLAERYSLSLYDASYLHVARSERLPLATLDRRLEAAARSENVSLAIRDLE